MWRIAAVALLSTLLSGCFGSDRPMFPLSSAVQPLEGGRYAVFEQYGDQKKPSEYIDVKLRTDGVYDFINDKGAVNPVTFHPVAGGLHVAQVGLVPQGGTDKKGYGYALFRVSGREARVYVVDCSKQDKAKLAAAGVTFRGDYECFIDNVADPGAFLAGLTRTEPPSRIVRE